MSTVLNAEWRDENLLRKFPFSDSATMRTSTQLSIPVDIIVDARLWHFRLQAPIWLQSISITDGIVEFVVTDINGFKLSGNSNNQSTNRIILYDEFEIPGGILVFAEQASIGYFVSWVDGKHECAPGSMEFALRTWIPRPSSGLRGFILPDSTKLYGPVVRIAAGLGVWFTLEEDDSVYWHIAGDPLASRLSENKCKSDLNVALNDYYTYVQAPPGHTRVFGDGEVPSTPLKAINEHDARRHVILTILPTNVVSISPEPSNNQLRVSMVNQNG